MLSVYYTAASPATVNVSTRSALDFTSLGECRVSGLGCRAWGLGFRM